MGLGKAFTKYTYRIGRWVPRSGYSVPNAKRGNKNFYKGKGVPAVGRHTKHGGYVLVKWKLPEYVVPDLTDFKLQAFVADGRKTDLLPPAAQAAATTP